jgi:hypothetical protein
MRLLQVFAAVVVLLFSISTAALRASASDDRSSVVIVYKDGHRQALACAEIARINLSDPATIVYRDGHREKLRATIDRIEFGESGLSATIPGRSHFIGKWEVGEGTGNGATFLITLEANGEARKTHGLPHGTWTLVDGEARISWDDGWHDVIRKTSSGHQKLAYEPGRSFDDEPSNVTDARNTEPKPI